MSLLIQGPKQPGNEIDVYFSPLTDDLKTLWSPGFVVHDGYMNENFRLRAMVFCTISDFPAYGNLSGYGTKGSKACPICHDNTCSRWLKYCKKTVYMGHRRSLPPDHPYRNMGNLFDGYSEYGSLPPPPDGETGKPKTELMFDMKIRPKLAPQENSDGKRTYLPAACYTLSKDERTSFCKCLNGVKVPSGYSSNVKRLVSMKDNKLIGMKSHDCHVLMTQMIPIAIRGILPEHIRYTITKLCLFFNSIHSKVIDPEALDTLQHDVIVTLCQLEMYFPPSFFYVMVHLVSHIVYEIKACGPVFLRYMYPFERYMGILKKYVRNRARLEGSIVEGYASEEILEFCNDYLRGSKSIGLPERRHRVDCQGLTNRRKSDKFLAIEHNTFESWLKYRVSRSENVDEEVKWLAYSPSERVTKYQGYDINSYTFYTKQQDAKSTMQNSGVTLIATTTGFSTRSSIAKDSYYGVIEEIVELDYNAFSIPMLKCKWVENRRGVKVDNFGITTVDLSTNGYASEPFILAKLATQVFYIEDPSNSRSHVVLHGKRRILGVENVVNEEEYDQLDELPPFSTDTQSTIVVADNTIYLRSDHDEGLWIDNPRST
uniref:uncharacterized protein LOC122596982 n=1 Tax=Erigeron canadensis TaxID=72917 RepID=UPI001CB8D03C|nr:uncharacterized protein LOC122596982 [Erigeron canadensis]